LQFQLGSNARNSVLAEVLESRQLLSTAMPQSYTDVSFQIGRLVADHSRNLVYVADQTHGRVIAVDTESGRATSSRQLGGLAAGMAVSSDGSQLFVAEPGVFKIEVLSLPDLTPVRSMDVGLAVNNIATTSVGKLLVSTPGVNWAQLHELDAVTGKTLWTHRDSIYWPLLRSSPDGTKVYTRALGLSGAGGAIGEFTLSATAAPVLTHSYSAYLANSRDFVVDEAHRRIYTADGGVYGVGVANMDSGAVTYWPADEPYGVAVAQLPGGPLVYGAAGSDSTVTAFDRATGIKQHVYVPPATSGYWDVMSEGLKITPNGRLIYAASNWTGTSAGYLYRLNSIGTSSLTIADVPVARFTSAATGGPTFTFDATASETYRSGQTITNYAWDFGDGNVATGATASHTYSTPGAYNVRLTVTSSSGKVDDYTSNVSVEWPKPVAGIAAPSNVVEGGTGTLTGNGTVLSGRSISAYEWDLDYDGLTFNVDSTAQSPSISVGDGPDLRLVALRVRDDLGQVSAVVSRAIGVVNMGPTASFAAPSTVAVGTPVTASFSDVKDGSAADIAAGFTYSFDFNNDGDFVDPGDVSGSTSPTASHVYTTPGNYIVRAIVTDKDGGWTQHAAAVSVGPPAVPPVVRDQEPWFDTFVRNGTYAGQNFGGQGNLEIKYGTSGYAREGYMLFPLSAATASDAKLRVFARMSQAGVMNLQVFGAAAAGWNELGVTWNSKPTVTTGVLASASLSSTTGVWLEFDVSDYVRQQQLAGATQVAFQISTLDSPAAFAIITSRESPSNEPVLRFAEQPAPKILASTSSVTVPESGSVQVGVSLSAAPPVPVTVTFGRYLQSDPDLTPSTPIQLTFTPQNWSVAQIVTIGALADDDVLHGKGLFVLNAAGYDQVQIAAIEADNTPLPPPPPPTVPPPPPADSPRTIAPLIDTYVRDGSFATDVYGGQTQLQVKKSTTGYNREALLRFPITPGFVGAGVTSAILRVYGRASESSGIQVDALGTLHGGWNEEFTNWSGRPPAHTGVLTSATIKSTGWNWIEFDVTSFVQARRINGDNEVNLILRGAAASNAHAIFNSREGTPKPELRLTEASVRSIDLSSASVYIDEKSGQNVQVKLNSAPESDVIVTVQRVAGDTTASASPQTLVFTPRDWSTPQTVRFEAAADADTSNGVATFSVSATGYGSRTVTVNVRDIDAPSYGGWNLQPIADAYVRDGSYASQNFGSSTALEVRKSTVAGNSRWTLLKFDLSQVTSVGSAILYLNGYAVQAGSVKIDFYGASTDAWDENTVTWNNKPGLAGARIASFSQAITGSTPSMSGAAMTTWIRQQLAAGKKTVSLIVLSPEASTTAATFSSDEAAERRPYLHINP